MLWFYYEVFYFIHVISVIYLLLEKIFDYKIAMLLLTMNKTVTSCTGSAVWLGTLFQQYDLIHYLSSTTWYITQQRDSILLTH